MGRGEKAHPTILVATLYIYATGWHRPEALADNGSRNLKIIGRGEGIRTSGLYAENVALYQAKLHPAAFLRSAF